LPKVRATLAFSSDRGPLESYETGGKELTLLTQQKFLHQGDLSFTYNWAFFLEGFYSCENVHENPQIIFYLAQLNTCCPVKQPNRFLPLRLKSIT